MITENDLTLDNGHTLHIYDTGKTNLTPRLTVFWHHGTPNLGTPPEPLFAKSEELGVRWVGYDRPGYGGSSPLPNRDIASAARLVASVADALGIDTFAVMGHSGGGPHALACGALLTERVVGVVCGAGLAPFGAEGLDWFGGMNPSGAASLRAAANGRTAKEAYEAANTDFDETMFTPEDYAALSNEWSWLNSVVGPAMKDGPGGLIDDDLAYVAPWGFDPAEIKVPTLLLHGERDRIVPSSHSVWLEQHIPTADLRLLPNEGHISVLNGGASALDWLLKKRSR